MIIYRLPLLLLNLIAGLAVPLSLYCQPIIKINQEANELVVIKSAKCSLPSGFHAVFSGNESFVFKGKFHPYVYADSTQRTGLRFEDGTYNYTGKLLVRPQVHLTVQDSTWHDSPVVTLSNATVKFNGLWKADNNYTKPILNLYNGSRFEFMKRSNMQLVFPAYGNFTRQLWAKSDGSGTVALMPGFIADRSEEGKKSEGCGSIRFYNCNLETHDSAGLPVYYRPEPKDKSKAFLNSHLVWERAGAKSSWVVKGSDQHFIGGLWVYDSVFTITTQKNLHISGKLAYWSDYINYGGVIWAHTNVSIAKRGKARLTISGDWNTMRGSRLIVTEGELAICSDPAASKHEPIKIAQLKTGHEHGQFLTLTQAKGTSLILGTDSLHLAGLELNGNNRISIESTHVPTISTLGLKTEKTEYTVNLKSKVPSNKSEAIIFLRSPLKPSGTWYLNTPKHRIALEWIEISKGTYGLRPA